jgi:hypothetical protein
MGNSQKPQLTPGQEEDLRYAEIEKRFQSEKEIILKRSDLTHEMKATLIDSQEKSRRLEQQRILIQKLETNISNTQLQYSHSAELCEYLIQKYHNMVLLFAVITLMATGLCFTIFAYFSLRNYEHSSHSIAQAELLSPSSCQLLHNDKTFDQFSSGSSSSPSNPLIITPHILGEAYKSFFENYCRVGMCDSEATSSTLLWNSLRSTSQMPHHQISYSNLLSLLSTHILPTLSFSLIAVSVAVVLSSLGAGFSVVYFWQTWSPLSQLCVGLLYSISFIGVGVYLYQTSSDRTLEIPAGLIRFPFSSH